MFYLPYRGAGISQYYTPVETFNYYKSIIDSDNLIDLNMFPLTDLFHAANEEEYSFREEVINELISMIHELDPLLLKEQHWNKKIIGYNISQGKYSTTILSKIQQDYLKKQHLIQLKQSNCFVRYR
jgi:hypothetical protein